MLRWHRLFAILSLPILLYVIATGMGTQLSDMVALVSHAPETSASMRRMREHIYGPPNFAVISATDYAALAMPAALDYNNAMARAAKLGREAAPGSTLRLVELRNYQSNVAAHVRMDKKDMVFDLTTGAALTAAALPWPQPPGELDAPRAEWKAWHRLSTFGFLGTFVNALAGIAISTLAITGLIHYGRLYKARARLGRKSPFWSGGSLWRTLHRSLAIAAVVPVLWLVASGLALAIDNIVPGIEGLAMKSIASGPNPFEGDFSKPIADIEVPSMTRVTLAAFAREKPGIGIKVLQLRYFANYPQGVVIAADNATSQLIYNAKTGEPMSMDEPGYPKLAFPTGWEWHQRLKRIHRGDFLAMPGRWLATLTGLSLLYLLISGSVMYARLRRAPRSNVRRKQ